MNIRAVLARIDTLPPMPAVAMELLKAARNPDVDLAQVAGWIERDAAMATNMLRLANSPFYGLRAEVTSIRQATSLMGLRKVVQIALMVLSSRYLAPAQEGYALAAGELWKSSVATAVAAEFLAREARYSDPNAAYTAGLLQDIGKIILADFVLGATEEIHRLVDHEGLAWEEAEQRTVGLPHPEVGALLLERWSFPAALVEAVRYHHHPGAARLDPALTRVSHVANALAMTVGVGLGADGLAYGLDETAAKAVGLGEPGKVESLLAELAAKLQEAEGFLPAQGG